MILLLIGLYCALIMLLSWYVSRQYLYQSQSGYEYFLAGRKLRWWSVGCTLVAANFSIDQMQGITNSVYFVGLVVIAWEWLSALSLVFIAHFIFPRFYARGLYTTPQFLQQVYGDKVRWMLAMFWAVSNVLIFIPAMLWVSASALHLLFNWPIVLSIITLALVTLLYSNFAGIRVIATTDCIHLVVMLIAGLSISVSLLLALSEQSGAVVDAVAANLLNGGRYLLEKADTTLDLLLTSEHPWYQVFSPFNVLLVIPLINLFYWGFNHTIAHKALAAKSLAEGQKGLLFAAVIKLTLPTLFIVIPGAASVVLFPGMFAPFQDSSLNPNQPFIQLILTQPDGIKIMIGLAIVAGCLSTLATLSHSTSGLFTLDLFRFLSRQQNTSALTNVGRLSGIVAMTLGVALTFTLSGNNAGNTLGFLQQMFGVVSPLISSLFLVGIFYRNANVKGAVSALIATPILHLAILPFLALDYLSEFLLVLLTCILLNCIFSSHNTDFPRYSVFKQARVSTEIKIISTIIIVAVIALYGLFS